MLAAQYSRFHLVNALDIARQAGNPKALNVAFVGALSRHFDIPESIWQDAIAAILPQKLVALNRKAFALARQTI